MTLMYLEFVLNTERDLPMLFFKLYPMLHLLNIFVNSDFNSMSYVIFFNDNYTYKQ